MTDVLTHRGPDGDGYYSDAQVSLGHRRLSIIDIDGGAQPISNEDGSLQLICNGEIYNSPELRRELSGRGHAFKTQTDVEVILHLYEEHAERCVEKLQGMFAFAIWDARNRSLFMARDHLGQKPLYFHHGAKGFAFGSEVKSVLASGLVDPELDLEGLWHYVSLRYLPDQYSLFKGIRKLPAATSLTWRDGELSFSHYWTPSFLEKRKGSDAELEDELDELLKSTVQSHLLSDVRVGAFLSGGIDSSTIAAMMAESTDSPVATFSIGVKDQGFNELPYAQMVNDKYAMEGHSRVVEADLVQLIPKMINHMDEPSDPFGVGVYLVSALASEHVKVVLGGDGGDENFAGYDRFAGQRIAEYYSWLPEWLRRQVVGRAASMIPESYGYKSLAQKVRWVNEMSFHASGERYYQSLSFLRFTHDAKQQLFTQSARDEISDWNSSEKIIRFFGADNVDDLVDRMLYTDLMTRMPDHLLMIVDRMSMAHSLESRSPMLDYRFVEFAASLPGNQKLRGRRLKHILREVSTRYLPDELVNRPKQGFAFPLGIWMRTDLRVFMERLFDDSRLVQADIFQHEYVQHIMNEHVDGKADHNFRLWILINLEFWYRMYIEGRSVDEMSGFADRLLAA